MTIPETIKEERVRQSVTQSEIAEAMGMDQSQYSRFESGRKWISRRRLERGIEFLGLKLKSTL